MSMIRADLSVTRVPPPNVGGIETSEEFGLRIDTEAYHRGWDRTCIRVVMGDGSHWIWNIADQHLPGAIQIVDRYHARERLWDLGGKRYPADETGKKRRLIRQLDWLEIGKIARLVGALRKRPTRAPTWNWLRRLVSRPVTSRATRIACATPSFVKRNFSLAPASLVCAVPTRSSPSVAVASAANLKTTGRRAQPDRPLLCRAPHLTAHSSSRRSERWSGFRGSRKPAHDTGLTPTKEADFLERCLSRKLVVEVLLRGIQQRILGKQSSCRLEHLACVRGVARLPEAHGDLG